jgi:hypothetical protein
VIEDEGAAGVHVGRDAAEGNGQVVEAGKGVVGEGGAVEDEADLLAGVEAFGEGETVLEAEVEAIGEVFAVLLAAIAEIAEGCASADGDIPVYVVEKFADLVGGATLGVEAADAGADDEVYGDVVLLEIVDDADVGEAEGSASFEHEGDAGTFGCIGVSILESGRGICRSHSSGSGS